MHSKPSQADQRLPETPGFPALPETPGTLQPFVAAVATCRSGETSTGETPRGRPGVQLAHLCKVGSLGVVGMVGRKLAGHAPMAQPGYIRLLAFRRGAVHAIQDAGARAKRATRSQGGFREAAARPTSLTGVLWSPTESRLRWKSPSRRSREAVVCSPNSPRT